MTLRKQIMSKLKSLLVVSCGGVGTFAAINIYHGNEDFYDNIAIPLIHKLDPEWSHNLAVFACKHRLFPKSKFKDPPTLATTVFGIQFSNPVGVAAGLDKQGEAIEGLLDIGFGFVEVGSVTPEPQPGQDKPRLFRLPEQKALINRMGFNSDGHATVHARIKSLRATETGSKLCIGVNLGKNKETEDALQDYGKGIKVFSDVADYLVVNVSSPNTPGLRDLQEPEQLKHLLTGLLKIRNEMPQEQRRPLLLKLSPDLTPVQRKAIASVVMEPKCRVDGLVISNTTTTRPEGVKIEEAGGLSGRPLFSSSTDLISDMYRLTKGELPIIGVGGVGSGLEAYLKILAGASLVQVYTAFTYKGPPMVNRLRKELQEHLEINGFHNVKDAVGISSIR
ncbi:hypothetical protein B566_EDAN004713 [Ephemera danica]|nr:hypothetical protein B566_EDAN004713 [Ephemera danica]